MQGPVRLVKSFRGLITFSIFAVFVLALVFFVYSLELDKRLDVLCETTQWQKCAELLNEDYRFWNQRPRAILKQYFLDLAANARQDQSSQSTLIQMELLPDSGACADALCNAAHTLEYDEYLPHLAEANIRCAVGIYRRRLEASGAFVVADPGALAADQRRRKSALIEGLKTLAELYRNHGKTFIADRALAESRQLASSKH